MFKKSKRGIRQLLFLLVSLMLIGNGLFAQDIQVVLDDTRDCNLDNYCVSIQLKTSGEAINIGTSSIFMKYNPAAITYSSYTSSHFDGSDQCIENKVSSWDVQTFDATSAPGFFNLTMTLLTKQFSCPSITEEVTEVGLLCFTVVDEKKSPNLKILKNNTSFNSSIPNTGEQLYTIRKVDHINNPNALKCSESSINCEEQKELWEETEVALDITNCEEMASFCTGISFNNKGVYELLLNDLAIEEVKKCEEGNTTFFYTYSSLLKLEKKGDFEVVKWTLNNEHQTATFHSIEELINQLNAWDNSGNWAVDKKTNAIIGGTADQNYGTIEIKNKETDLSITMALNKKVSDYSTAIALPEGVHQLLATNKYTKCKDAITIVVTCKDEAEERIAVAKEAVITITKDTALCLTNYISDTDYLEDCSDQLGTSSKMTIDNNTNCINLFPTAAGTDKYCLYICDEEDHCVTLNLTIEVLDNMNPILRDDQVAINMNEAKTIDVIQNDFINEPIIKLEVPYSRMDGSVKVDEFAEQITYTPAYNACGIQDSFQYKVITEVGESIATVYLDLLCEELTVFSGFSPNGDGINDYLKIMGIDNFETNELIVFNSRGNEVYSKRGYQNEDGWDGTWKGKPLPDGTYFYMLRLNKQKPISGYLQLQR